MRIHYLQHVPFENPGYILEWAHKNGHTLTRTLMYTKEPLPRQESFDWLIVMGGPMNIYEEDTYSWLIEEKAFIKESIAHDKVIIGLCLGAQLIADVLGGLVTKNAQTEIGWFPVFFTDKARDNELFSFLPSNATVFQWHGDTFSHLPMEVDVIATGSACQNQAFMYRDRIFGFQFHMENTRQIIESLILHCADEMSDGEYIQTPKELLAHPEYITQTNEWMETFLQRLADRDNKGKK